MNMKPLGRTGMMVSEICLGTMTWGEQNTEAEGHQQMDLAVAEGINFFDTAEMYSTNPTRPETQGRTEEIIGSWFARSGRRNDVILATKMSGRGIKWVRDGAPISRATVAEAVDGSLKRLGVDHIDHYQLHWPNRGSYCFRQNWTYDPGKQPRDAADDIHDTLEGLGDAVKAGKIRAIGLSNESAWGTMQFLKFSEAHDLPRVASIQNEYSLLSRLFDTDMAELSVHEDVGLLAYSPLAAGLLTGKYQNGALPAGSRRSITANLGGRWTPQAEAAVDAYHAVAKKHGLDPVHMALAFCMSRPFMTSTIIGATSMEQLRACLGAREVTLSSAAMADIDATHRQHRMPY